MSITDLRLKYQKEFGGSLDSINREARDCSPEYVEWLEESLITMIEASKHMLDLSTPSFH